MATSISPPRYGVGLLAASAATLDRLLKPIRPIAGSRRKRRRRQSMGKRIPVRTCNDWGRPPPLQRLAVPDAALHGEVPRVKNEDDPAVLQASTGGFKHPRIIPAATAPISATVTERVALTRLWYRLGSRQRWDARQPIVSLTSAKPSSSLCNPFSCGRRMGVVHRRNRQIASRRSRSRSSQRNRRSAASLKMP